MFVKKATQRQMLFFFSPAVSSSPAVDCDSEVERSPRRNEENPNDMFSPEQSRTLWTLTWWTPRNKTEPASDQSEPGTKLNQHGIPATARTRVAPSSTTTSQPLICLYQRGGECEVRASGGLVVRDGVLEDSTSPVLSGQRNPPRFVDAYVLPL